jgi:hypothetical protein
MTLLADAEWAGWSDREIARRCAVSDPFVGKLRPEPSANSLQIPRTVERGGTVYTMNAGGINASRQREDRPVFDNTPAGRDEHPPVVQYDHAAAEVRTTAIDAIKALAGGPLVRSPWPSHAARETQYEPRQFVDLAGLISACAGVSSPRQDTAKAA